MSARNKTGCASLIVLLVTFALFSQPAPAVPDRPAPGEPANTEVIVVVPAKAATIQNQMLEVLLHEYDPRVKDQDTVFDKHVVKAFRHVQGSDTRNTITLGAAKTTRPGMRYYVTVAISDKTGRRTYLGEKNGTRGLCSVLADDRANQVTMIVRLAKPHDIVMDIADEIKKGNDTKATAMAKTRAKDFTELYDVMNLYRPRTRKGMGWGSAPANINVIPQDALENKLRNLARGVPFGFLPEDKNNEEAAYWVAALAELTMARDSEFRPMGNKTKLDWRNKAAQVRFEAIQFARAVTARDEFAVKTSAQAIVNACDKCHLIYRD